MKIAWLATIAWLALSIVAGCRQQATQPERLGSANSTPAVPTPATTSQSSCEPTFLKVSDKSIVAWSGYWKIGFEGYLIGCKADLVTLTVAQRDLISEHLRTKVRIGGRSYIVAQQEESERAILINELGKTIGEHKIKDILLVIRYSIEHEPVT